MIGSGKERSLRRVIQKERAMNEMARGDRGSRIRRRILEILLSQKQMIEIEGNEENSTQKGFVREQGREEGFDSRTCERGDVLLL